MTCSVSPTGEWVAWAGAQRTENMYSMVVTLEVSKVSGWLNAYAPCQVQRGAWEAGDMQSAGGRRPVGGSQGSMWGPPSWRIGQEPHRKHVIHMCDARRVDTQQLVERIRALPSPKAGIACGRYGGPGDGRVRGRWPK